MMTHAIRAAGLAFLVLVPLATRDLAAQASDGTLSDDRIVTIDGIFGDFDSARTPGCAVAVAGAGIPVLRRAYGMANLEVGVSNSAETIFEAGSVSKQFTAAAVVLLALDGELSLEDDVRMHVPEIPDYGPTITLRHMLTHTSGLRDWGSVAAISGWGRGARTHTHDHVLDILGRQSALNFAPGDQYSYSNSGYNLLAIIVSRVSGMSFADFSRERIFEPLGLHQTHWRDDYRRVVPGRSSAYSAAGGGFRINHPIEDVHGNGGLLTTVDDLLAWNEHLRAGTLGEAFMAEMHTRGILNDGEEIAYASGLQFGTQNGTTRISHTGATAGYRAYLALFPEEALSIALLCNVTSANPGVLGGRVAEAFLPPVAAGDEGETAGANGAGRAEIAGPAGTRAGQADGAGQIEGAEGAGDAKSAAGAGDAGDAGRADASRADLSEYLGTYHSSDAETTLNVALDEGELVVHRRPATRLPLREADGPDTFGSAIGSIRFIRDAGGAITEFSLRQDRVHDMRFYRVQADAAPAR